MSQRRVGFVLTNRNTGLLSFGEAEEEDATAVTVKKKDMGRRDRELPVTTSLTSSRCWV